MRGITVCAVVAVLVCSFLIREYLSTPATINSTIIECPDIVDASTVPPSTNATTAGIVPATGTATGNATTGSVAAGGVTVSGATASGGNTTSGTKNGEDHSGAIGLTASLLAIVSGCMVVLIGH